MSSNEQIFADVLIIGSGLAGLLLALKLTEHDGTKVVLATKGALIDSNSSFAQGGLAAVTDANAFDSPQSHLQDTLKAGAGLTDAGAAQSIIYGGARLVQELSKLGVSFDKKDNGTYELALEGGHSQSRVLHSKDTTGRAITTALAAELVRRGRLDGANLTILEHAQAYELLTRVDNSACVGAKFLSGETAQRSHFTIMAPHTVLATGGIGQVFERTTNPAIATGDGIALAFNAGAVLRDMEFVQFHPTAFCMPGAPAFLISEAVRGAGARLLDHKGRRFMKRFHDKKELATRDIVSRAIQTVMNEYALPNVYLDMRPIGREEILRRFPNIVKTCAQLGVDLLEQPIPVCPAAHYFMGGVQAGVDGTTSLPGLYAIGECASTGLHGGNRLASNSLLEAGVCALNLADLLLGSGKSQLSAEQLATTAVVEGYTPHIVPADITRFRSLMYRHAGLVRSEVGLAVLLHDARAEADWAAHGAAPTRAGAALTKADAAPAKADAITAAAILQVGRLIAQAALIRCESRGSHFRSDFPSANDAQFARHLLMSKNGTRWEIPQAGQAPIHRQAAFTA